MSTTIPSNMTRLGNYSPAVNSKPNNMEGYLGVGRILLWIILFVFVWVLIVSFAPNWCRHERDCGEYGPPINFCKVAMHAFMISLAVMIIIAVLYNMSGSNC